MTNWSSPAATSESTNTDDAHVPTSPSVASTAAHNTHWDLAPPAPSAGLHGWYPAPTPYPMGYSWPPQPHALLPPAAPLQPSWNNYHLAAHAMQNAVPLPPMFGPPPLQHTIMANPYAGSPIDYTTSPAYQVPQVYHSGFPQTSPPHPVALGHPGTEVSNPPPGQLTPFHQPALAGQYWGPIYPPLYHPVEPGALSTASQTEVSGSQSPTIGRRTERTKRTKQTPFVMWVGNIDSTVTVQELYEFFRQIDPTDSQTPEESAVVSIFLIPKSNCAFVNFRTETALTESVTRFHGARLRVFPGAPRLACRKRTVDHCDLDGEWDEGGDEKGVQEAMDQPSPNARYFIVKSLTHASDTPWCKHRSHLLIAAFPQTSLQESVQSGMWATQLHNEPPLDRAYHSCEAVYLIFGANKSGEFFGYAKMGGPIFDEEYSSNGAPPVESGGSTGSEERRWGKPFPIEWIRTNPLSFKKTQHLLDPWNQNREVKISTDGQEIESSIGRQLLALWH